MASIRYYIDLVENIFSGKVTTPKGVGVVLKYASPFVWVQLDDGDGQVEKFSSTEVQQVFGRRHDDPPTVKSPTSFSPDKVHAGLQTPIINPDEKPRPRRRSTQLNLV
jgi:hypothetical protein